MKYILFVLVGIIFLVFSSCGQPLGNRVDTQNLKVYYLDNVDKSIAIAFAEYWRDNNFIGSKDQYVQLDQKDNIYYIRLIEEEEYHDQNLSIADLSKLHELERNLAREVFHKRVVIEITDNTFRPIDR